VVAGRLVVGRSVAAVRAGVRPLVAAASAAVAMAVVVLATVVASAAVVTAEAAGTGSRPLTSGCRSVLQHR
jgi:hypothetical protein